VLLCTTTCAARIRPKIASSSTDCFQISVGDDLRLSFNHCMLFCFYKKCAYFINTNLCACCVAWGHDVLCCLRSWRVVFAWGHDVLCCLGSWRVVFAWGHDVLCCLRSWRVCVTGSLTANYLAANKRFTLTAHSTVCDNSIGPVQSRASKIHCKFFFPLLFYFSLRLTLQYACLAMTALTVSSLWDVFPNKYRALLTFSI